MTHRADARRRSPTWRRACSRPGRHRRRSTLDHIHAPRVSVAEHTEVLRELLAERGRGDVRRAGRRLRRDPGDRGAVPGAAAPVPGVGGGLRSGRAAGRADRTVDGAGSAPPTAGRRGGTATSELPTSARASAEVTGRDGDPGDPHADRELPVPAPGSRSTRRASSTCRSTTVPDHDLVGALEAVLLVVDAPGPRGGARGGGRARPERVHERAGRAGRPVHGGDVGHRAARVRRRLAVLHPRPVRTGGRAVRAGRRRRAGCPRRAGDPGGRRLPAAGDPGPDRGGPRRQRRRRGAHADRPRADRRTTAPTRTPAASLYRTTELFLDRMGLGDLDELPSLGPLLPDIDAIGRC